MHVRLLGHSASEEPCAMMQRNKLKIMSGHQMRFWSLSVMAVCWGNAGCENKRQKSHFFTLFAGAIRTEFGDNFSGWDKLLYMVVMLFSRWVAMFFL